MSGSTWVQGTAEVWNLEVGEDHTYAAGALQAWVHNGCGRGVDPSKRAQDVLPGSLKREFPGEHLDKSLDEIKAALGSAAGDERRALQKAKKLLEQAERLLEKSKMR